MSMILPSFLKMFEFIKPNLIKCEVSGIGVLKAVQTAVCVTNYTNLKIDTIKISGIL